MNIETALIKTYSAKKKEAELVFRLWNPLLYLVLLFVTIYNYISTKFYELKFRYMLTGSILNGKPSHIQKFKERKRTRYERRHHKPNVK